MVGPALGSAEVTPRPAVDRDCPWLVPVDAPVVDPYREPTHPYGPGNRGIEYDVVAGEPVWAVAGGRIGFVGMVAGNRYLVIEHPAGLRSTYGPVGLPDVVRGQSVRSGDQVATALPGLHLTARLGDAYIDPQPLIDGDCGRPHLVPPPACGAHCKLRNSRCHVAVRLRCRLRIPDLPQHVVASRQRYVRRVCAPSFHQQGGAVASEARYDPLEGIMRYLLSKLIPMRFTSHYGITNPDRTTYVRSTW